MCMVVCVCVESLDFVEPCPAALAFASRLANVSPKLCNDNQPAATLSFYFRLNGEGDRDRVKDGGEKSRQAASSNAWLCN